jgi:hypothetical protein
MSTNDVPGAIPAHKDKLAMGCWAEHEDGSLIFVESTEADSVVYSIFDVAAVPIVEYRDAMPIKGFQRRFSWSGKDATTTKLPADVKWTWHDKTAFPWERVMEHFPPGSRNASATATMSAAERVARSLDLRAEPLRERALTRPGQAIGMMARIRDAVAALRG